MSSPKNLRRSLRIRTLRKYTEENSDEEIYEKSSKIINY